MMPCEDYELLMADALAGEISEADRGALQAHLANCDRCREDYESSGAAIAAMRTLPAPRRVSVERQGDRLVIRSDASPAAVPWGGGWLRYAAGLLIAFSAGYGLHAGILLMGGIESRPAPPPIIVAVETPPSAGTLEGALVRTHHRRPARSSLAKCLIATAPARLRRP